MFQMMCVIAELERNLIAERVKEGLEASKKRGKKFGRPEVDKDKVTLALRMYDSKEYSVKEIIEGTGFTRFFIQSYSETNPRNNIRGTHCLGFPISSLHLNATLRSITATL